MRVHLLYFGMLRERMGAGGPLELPGGATVATLLAHLAPATGVLLGSLAVAVNRVYARPETLLAEGDEVALLPPVSGGCDAR